MLITLWLQVRILLGPLKNKAFCQIGDPGLKKPGSFDFKKLSVWKLVQLTEKTMATKVCNHCGLEKDEEEFSWR